MLNQSAGDPWRFRILSEYIVALVRQLIPSWELAFLTVRVLQNCVIGLLAYRLYRRISRIPEIAVLGVALLFVSISSATYDSDLSFNTYTEVILYLWTVSLALEARLNLLSLALLTSLGVLNRETAILLPAVYWLMAPREYRSNRSTVLALTIGVSTLLGTRILIGPGNLIDAYGNTPGLEMLSYNLRWVTLDSLAITFCFPLLLAVLAVGKSSTFRFRTLSGFFALTWIPLHLFASVIAESRLLLVPVAIALIPLVMVSCREAVEQRRTEL